MSGQTLTDRLAAAQYSLTGSEVSRAVCKATTHEQTPPKKKHMECKLPINQKKSINLSIYHVLLYYSHPPSYSSTTRPCAAAMVVVPPPSIPLMGSIMCTQDFLCLSVFSQIYQPNLLAMVSFLYCVWQPGHIIEPEGSHRAFHQIVKAQSPEAVSIPLVASMLVNALLKRLEMVF